VNAREILNELRQILDELSPHTWEDADLIAFVNAELQGPVAAQLQKLQPSSLWRSFNLDFSTGSDLGDARTIAYPENLIAPVQVEDIQNPESPRLLDHVMMQDRSQVGELSWFTVQERIGLAPKSAIPSGQKIRVWGVYLPPRVTLGKVDQAETSGSTSLVLAEDSPQLERSDDALNGARIEITTGAARGVRRTIVDHVGITRTITVDAPWGVAITTDDEFALIPSMPKVHHEVLVYGAAIRAAINEGNLKLQAAVRVDHRRLFDLFLSSIHMAREARPARVRRVREAWA